MAYRHINVFLDTYLECDWYQSDRYSCDRLIGKKEYDVIFYSYVFVKNKLLVIHFAKGMKIFNPVFVVLKYMHLVYT